MISKRDRDFFSFRRDSHLLFRRDRHQNLAVCILGHINYAAQFIQFINGTFQIIQTALDGFDFCIDSGDLALKLGLCGGDGCGDSLIDNTTISNRILDSLLISCCELGLCSFKCSFLFFKGRLDLGIVVGGNLCINSCKLVILKNRGIPV